MEYPVIIPICEDCPVKVKLSMRNRQIRDLRRTLRECQNTQCLDRQEILTSHQVIDDLRRDTSSSVS
jgi:hypothetical protein